MTSTIPDDAATALNGMVARLAQLIRRTEEVQARVDRDLADLRFDAEQLLNDLQSLSPTGLEVRSHDQAAALFSGTITNLRLREVWEALYRHSNGATADAIAGDLDRHRTTISTYLNLLVTMGYAKKHRSGHAIVYTAIVKNGHVEI